MRLMLILLFVFMGTIRLTIAQVEDIAVIRILPEDVVQDSIEQFRFATNNFAVRWTYTESGGQKMLAFWEAHQGKKVRTVIGRFQGQSTRILFQPIPPFVTNYTQWKDGWIKRRTDKVVGVSEENAKAIAAGLKKQ